jgi:hypothetical protein
VKFGIILYVFLLSLYACSGGNRIKVEDAGDGVRKITVSSGDVILEAAFQGERQDLDFFAGFVDRSMRRLCPYTANNHTGLTYRIPYNGDYYLLFYSIGLHLLSDWRNELLKYGIIEMEWRNLLRGGYLKSYSRNHFRIPDIDGVMGKYELTPEDEGLVDAYTVNFLIKEISFISVQELLSRQARYYNPAEIDTVFTRMTVIPESSEFTVYVLKKFGMARLKNLASTEYGNETWFKMTDEKINETEGSFAKNIENYKFTGIFENSGFTNELYGVLKTYNKNTKKTLFRK